MKSVIGFPAAVMAGFGDLFTDEKNIRFMTPGEIRYTILQTIV